MTAPRDNRLQLLLTDEERKLFDSAAERSGLTLSSWMRQACRAAILREEGRRLGILPPVGRKRG